MRIVIFANLSIVTVKDTPSCERCLIRDYHKWRNPGCTATCCKYHQNMFIQRGNSASNYAYTHWKRYGWIRSPCKISSKNDRQHPVYRKQISCFWKDYDETRVRHLLPLALFWPSVTCPYHDYWQWRIHYSKAVCALAWKFADLAFLSWEIVPNTNFAQFYHFHSQLHMSNDYLLVQHSWSITCCIVSQQWMADSRIATLFRLLHTASVPLGLK